jgi:branched-chain amino acid transport system substrate-binding protein
MIHAGVYAGVLHYLKAAVALKGNVSDGKTVVAQMKSMPTDDPLFGKGTIRPDGRKIHPAYLLEVKKPEESKHPGRLLQGPRNHSDRGGLSATEGRQLPACQRLMSVENTRGGPALAPRFRGD